MPSRVKSSLWSTGWPSLSYDPTSTETWIKGLHTNSLNLTHSPQFTSSHSLTNFTSPHSLHLTHLNLPHLPHLTYPQRKRINCNDYNLTIEDFIFQLHSEYAVSCRSVVLFSSWSCCSLLVGIRHAASEVTVFTVVVSECPPTVHTAGLAVAFPAVIVTGAVQIRTVYNRGWYIVFTCHDV